MNYLLFGGSPKTGKTEAINRLLEYLKSTGLTQTSYIQMPDEVDFFAVLDGTNGQGCATRILISSLADFSSTITQFQQFCMKNKPYDIIISAVRDDGDPLREVFRNTMCIVPQDIVIEIPMAKITRRNTTPVALQWYRCQIDAVVHRLLRGAPFFIR